MKVRLFFTVAIACTLSISTQFVGSDIALAKKPYPSKPIKCIVGYPPGGSVDAFTRTVSKYAPKYLGTKLKVINKPGSGGEIGLNTLANSKPDGYTIGHAVITNSILKPAIRPEGHYGYKTDDLQHITVLSKIPTTLYVKPDSPINSLTDLVAQAKKNSGKITVGTAGTYTVTDSARRLVEKATKIQLKRVVFQGGGELRKAIAGGHIDVMSSNAFFTVKAKDTLKPLGVASETRYALAPHVKTYKEQGFDITDFISRGFAAPKGVSKEVIAHLENGFRKMAEDPEFQADMKNIGYVIEFNDHTQAKAMVDDTTAKYAEIINEFKEELASKMK